MRNSGTLAGTGERTGGGEVVRDISFVSPSAGIEYETRCTKSSGVMRRKTKKEERMMKKKKIKESLSRFRLSLQNSGFHRNIKYLLYNV